MHSIFIFPINYPNYLVRSAMYVNVIQNKWTTDGIISFKANCELFKFGFSIFYVHIKLFECLLYIAYQLGVKTWQVNITNCDKC
jgi:hypothetical protein